MGEDLQARDADQKKTAAAKAESLQYKQSKQYLKPLLKSLKSKAGEIPEAVVARLLEIVQCCDARDYAKANDIYIALAMGQSGMAVGATALQVKEQGGVTGCLNDETTRKFIQAFKRLVTQCQTRWPAAA